MSRSTAPMATVHPRAASEAGAVEIAVSNALAVVVGELVGAVREHLQAPDDQQKQQPVTRNQGHWVLFALVVGALLMAVGLYEFRQQSARIEQYQRDEAEAEAKQRKEEREADDKRRAEERSADDKRHKELLDSVSGVRSDVDMLINYHARQTPADRRAWLQRRAPDSTSGASQ